MSMYKLKDPKFNNISDIETDRFGKLSPLGNRFIRLHYSPTDPDYQNAAISFMRDIGMNSADQKRTDTYALTEASLDIMKDCYYFSMNDLSRTSRDMTNYGIGYITNMYLKTGKDPLEILDDHLKGINDRYEAEHGALPDNVQEFRDAVDSYYRDVLNYGKQPYEIQAIMDSKSMMENKEQEIDFDAAVANIPVNDAGLSQI